MGRIVAFTGLTGKKSGGGLLEIISKNLSQINCLFPNGIRLLVRKSSNINYVQEMIPNIEICVGSFNDDAFLENALKKVDTVLHIAGIQSSLKLVDIAIKCNVRRLVLVHTTGIYSKYKKAGEEYRQIEEHIYEACKENNVLLTILRPTMIYGKICDQNVSTFIQMVDKFPLMPIVNDAKYQLQPVHYLDLSKAYFDVLVNEEKTINKDYILSGGEPIYLKEMFNIIGNNLGKKIKFINCPFFIAYFGAWVIFILTFTKLDYREKVQRLCEPRIFSYESAKEDFGYNPRKFEEGIIDEIIEYKQNKIKNKKY